MAPTPTLKIPGVSGAGGNGSKSPEYSSIGQHLEEEDRFRDIERDGDGGGLDQFLDDDDEEEAAPNENDNNSRGSGNAGFSRPPTAQRRRARSHPLSANERSSAGASANSVVFMLWVLLMVVLLSVVVVLLLFRHRTYYNEAMDAAHNRTHPSTTTQNKNDDGGFVGMVDDGAAVGFGGPDEAANSPFDDDAALPVEAQPHANHPVVPHETPQKKKKAHTYTVHYDATPHNWDPFDLASTEKSATPEEWFQNPESLFPWTQQPSAHQNGNNKDDDDDVVDAGYYAMQPHIVDDTLVFVTEGDLYLSRLVMLPNTEQNDQAQKILPVVPALKLTTTAGNVRTPVLHPTLPVVAFTATYTGRREVYLQDLRAPSSGTRRRRQHQLTFWGSSDYGVSSVVGWKDATTLLIAAPSMAVSLPDTRLYELNLATTEMEGKDEGDAQTLSTTPLQISPVPLSQALNGVYDESGPDHPACLYFTRFAQSSHTVRYVGGTAESLWVYCDEQELALPLTSNYNGTSKLPTFWYASSSGVLTTKKLLLFLSDRQWSEETASWYPTTMNLWALPLPSETEMSSYFYDGTQTPQAPLPAKPLEQPIQLTKISCDFHGKAIQDYSVDSVTQNVVLRIGGDVYVLTREQIQSRLMWQQQQQPQQQQVSSPPSSLTKPTRVPLHVFSDFHETHERLIPLKVPRHFKNGDVFSGPGGSTMALMTLRGQVWASPMLPEDRDVDNEIPYQGSGQVLPERTYRIAPGSLTGGSMRVLVARNVPLPTQEEGDTKRLAVILATDPQSPTAEHAFYLVESHASAVNVFNDLKHLPGPFLGGGEKGGLGSIHGEDVVVSPCGRRMAWTDTDGRICVMNLPLYNETNGNETERASSNSSEPSSSKTPQSATYTVLPSQNELGEPIKGLEAELRWSPGGRYLAINHLAGNQFYIISLVDLGDPLKDIEVGRVVQATPSRFNSMAPYWGSSRADASVEKRRRQMATLQRSEEDEKKEDDDEEEDSQSASTLYFLTDRDVMTDTSSPWGSRMPLPHFSDSMVMYALPLPVGDEASLPIGRFSGGGALEAKAERLAELNQQVKETLKEKEEAKKENAQDLDTISNANATNTTDTASKTDENDDDESDEDDDKSKFPKDREIDFGPKDLTFARNAYRMVQIPKADYIGIMTQTPDGSFVLVSSGDDGIELKVFSANDYPSDLFDTASIPATTLRAFGLSTCRSWVYLVRLGGDVQVVKNSLTSLLSAAKDSDVGKVDSNQIGLSVWPALEYIQLYNDAWRMLRDYFYDKEMHQVNWKEIHKRYLPLVKRCTKREELDDILAQMAAELSALHVFVYGGEYNSPMRGEPAKSSLHQPASLGATLQRTAEWKGYRVSEIAFRDPDYNLLEGEGVYSPLSDQALRPSGQKGLQVGDVIVAVNGESAFRAPDIHMLLRGRAGRSVRLEVIRLSSGESSMATENSTETPQEATPEPLVVVPIESSAASDLRYNAWEYQTRKKAKALAKEAGFSVGYAHLRSMSREDMDAFARTYFEDYDKDAMILDLRHNRGGNIDSWISAFFQRKPWSFFGDRTGTSKGRDMNWNQHFAFRGHLVVLIDEKTSSDGEGMARSVAELGLGYLIGKRTWGGGIWLSSDNRLVDGGIATAPEDGVYNDKWGWGMGIEQHGVIPDEIVDNNPRTSFDGTDHQLEHAIQKLKVLQSTEPITETKPPPEKPDMSLKNEQCGV